MAPWDLESPRRQPILDLLADGFEDLHPRVALVLGLDQPPSTEWMVGTVDHLLDGALVLPSLAAIAPVLIGQLPLAQRVLAPRLEPPELLLVGDVHPELDQHHALFSQRSLELDDLVVGASPLLGARVPLDPLHQDAAVPAPIQDRHPAPAGKHGPEAAQEVVPFLIRGRRGKLSHPDMARAHRRHQPFYRAALAGRIPTSDT